MSELSAARRRLAPLSAAQGARITAPDARIRAALQATGAENAEMDFLAVCAIRSLGLGTARPAGLAAPPRPRDVPAR